jgi:DNA-binding HxlR family transcriptional regulator
MPCLKTSVSNQFNSQVIDFGFQRIGGKYKGRIIWYINAHHVLRYGELKRRVQGISTKMLTQTLKELEEDKLITRVEYAELTC